MYPFPLTPAERAELETIAAYSLPAASIVAGHSPETGTITEEGARAALRFTNQTSGAVRAKLNVLRLELVK